MPSREDGLVPRCTIGGELPLLHCWTNGSSALHQTCRSAWAVGLAAGKKGVLRVGRMKGGRQPMPDGGWGALGAADQDLGF
jgi:hypothetical protein